MAIDKQNSKPFWDFTKGHAQDLSGNGYNGSLVAGKGFKPSKNGLAYHAGETGSLIQASFAADSSLNMYNKAFTVVLSGTPSSNTPVKTTSFSSGYAGIFVLKNAGGNTSMHCYFLSNLILIGDGADNRSFAFASGEFEKIRSIIITKATGLVKAKMYINGVFHSESSGTFDCADYDPTVLQFGRALALNDEANFDFDAFQLLPSIEKTPAEVAAIHNEVIKLKTPNVGTRPKDSLGSVSPNEKNLIHAWNCEKTNGKIMDLVSTNHGTVPPGITQSRLPWGEPCLIGNGAVNINVGAINLGTTHTISALLKYNADNDEAFGGTDANTYALGRFTNLVAYAPTFSNFVNWADVPALGRYYHYLMSRNGTSVSLYKNGSLISTQTLGTDAAFSFQYLGSESNLATYAFDGEWSAVKLFSDAKDANFAKKEYNRVANKVMYKQDFESAPVFSSPLSAGNFIPGTDLEVGAGTFKVSYDATKGQNVLECVSEGVVVRPMPQGGNGAYGTFELDAYRTAGLQVGIGFSDVKTTVASNGYNFYLHTTGTAARLWGSTVDIVVGNNSNALGVYHKLKMTRSTENAFTLYINNVLLGNITTGTNPITNSVHTTTKYLLVYMMPGTKVASIKKTFGVAI